MYVVNALRKGAILRNFHIGALSGEIGENQRCNRVLLSLRLNSKSRRCALSRPTLLFGEGDNSPQLFGKCIINLNPIRFLGNLFQCVATKSRRLVLNFSEHSRVYLKFDYCYRSSSPLVLNRKDYHFYSMQPQAYISCRLRLQA